MQSAWYDTVRLDWPIFQWFCHYLFVTESLIKMLVSIRGFEMKQCVTQGDCQFGWNLLGYYKMDLTFCSIFIAVRPFLFLSLIKTGMATRRLRGLWGDSRMCDPFCNDPASSTQTGDRLGNIYYITNYASIKIEQSRMAPLTLYLIPLMMCRNIRCTLYGA